MTPELVVAVVEGYEAELRKIHVEPNRISAASAGPDDALALAHVLWMCGETKLSAPKDMEKACRWLGFIQGVLWMTGLRTIAEMREDNRAPSDRNTSDTTVLRVQAT